MRHQAVSQVIRILKTTCALQGSLLIEMFQDLPMRHRDYHISFRYSAVGLR